MSAATQPPRFSPYRYGAGTPGVAKRFYLNACDADAAERKSNRKKVQDMVRDLNPATAFALKIFIYA